MTDLAHFIRREQEERTRAGQATNAAARMVHLSLARAIARRIGEMRIGRDKPPRDNS